MESKHKFELILSALRNELWSGVYPLGARFPSEYELADRFGVNKMTANKAVSQLVFEGYLQRGGRGSNTKVIMTEKFPKGYFVYIAPLAHEINRLILTGIENYAHSNLLIANFHMAEGNITEAVVQKTRALNEIAIERGETLAQMALAWVLRQKTVTSVLIGASNPKQIQENAAVVDAKPFTQAQLQKIDEIALGA